MKRIYRSIIPVMALLAASAMSSSCNKGGDLNYGGRSGNGLRFKICSVAGLGTKSSAEEWLQPVDLSEGEFPLIVTQSVSVNTATPDQEEILTKGALKTDQFLEDSCTSGIPMYMITSNASETNVKKGVLKKNPAGVTGEYWSLYDENGKKIDWVESDDMSGAKASFLSYFSGKKDTVVTAVVPEDLKFTYKGIKSDFKTGISNPNDADDAGRMEDFLVAYSKDIDHQGNEQNNTVLLYYYHPLAAVRFIAPVAADRDETVSISRVTISNVKTGGTVTYNANTDLTKKDAFKTAFSWSPADSLGSYSQKFSSNKDEMTFFIVPQDLDSVVVTFNIIHTNGGVKHEHQLSAPVSKLGTAKWEQGYLYTYTLDTHGVGKVDIEVGETFSEGDAVKQNVLIENKAQTTAYVRAMAIANWCSSEKGKVIDSCPLDATNVEINTDDWLLGKDGFYYCKIPVMGYDKSPVFIKKFTQPTDISGITNSTNIPGLHVEMVIIAQGIESDSYSPNGTTYIEKAWADANGKILLSNDDDLLDILKF